jgi:hypothetical protein
VSHRPQRRNRGGGNAALNPDRHCGERLVEIGIGNEREARRLDRLLNRQLQVHQVHQHLKLRLPDRLAARSTEDEGQLLVVEHDDESVVEDRDLPPRPRSSRRSDTATWSPGACRC